MIAMNFGTLNELTKYIADEEILQAKVQAVMFINGRWYLLYWPAE